VENMEIKKCSKTGYEFKSGDIAVIVNLNLKMLRMNDTGMFEDIPTGMSSTNEILSKEAFDKFVEIMNQINEDF